MTAPIEHPSWCTEHEGGWHNSAAVTVPPAPRSDMSVTLRLVSMVDYPPPFVEMTVDFGPSPDPEDVDEDPVELALPIRQAETMAAEMLALVARAAVNDADHS